MFLLSVKINSNHIQVIYQTRETVSHRNIKTPRRETTRSGVFLAKFEVFG